MIFNNVCMRYSGFILNRVMVGKQGFSLILSLSDICCFVSAGPELKQFTEFTSHVINEEKDCTIMFDAHVLFLVGK